MFLLKSEFTRLYEEISSESWVRRETKRRKSTQNQSKKGAKRGNNLIKS